MISLARSEGFSAAAIADMRAIVFDSGFRKYCEENLCGRYGANYSCPPDCGTPDAMKARLSAYKSALVLQTKWDITDYRDMPAIKAAKQSHNQAMLRVIARLKQEGIRGKMAGASCCTLCERCAILDSEPCRDPERQFSCMSAYCIDAGELAKRCNLPFAWNPQRLHLFGMIMFRGE